jgi:propionate CoA-transferase
VVVAAPDNPDGGCDGRAGRVRLASIAQATKNLGGIVIVQVERVTTRHTLPPRDVRIPGVFVDGVVVAEDSASQMQKFAEDDSPAYVGEVPVAVTRWARWRWTFAE